MDFDGQDDDSSFIETQTVGKVSTFATRARPILLQTVALVSWVAVTMRLTALSGFPRAVYRLVSQGQVFEGPAVAPAVGSYTTFDGAAFGSAWLAFFDPATGKPWTFEAAMLSEFGLRFSSGGGNDIRCTQLRKRVNFAMRPEPNAVRFSRGL
jgi:hypothetical protein